MQKKVLKFISEHHMLQPGDRVLVAVSGGADSVCLLTLLCQLRETLSLDAIFAVHMHHGLRGREADRDAAYVEELCSSLKVPCTVVYRDVPGYAEKNGCSFEAAGRILRYETFMAEAVVHGLTKIAVAHHRDDEAETILHHLIRGSGLKGLAGIPVVRGQIIRPLLCVDRKMIEIYLAEKQIFYCMDSTNETDDYTRNKIRRNWIPLVMELNDQAVNNICQAGEFIGQADAYLESQAKELLARYGHGGGGESKQYAAFPVAVMLGQPEILQTYLIRQMVRGSMESMKDISASHIFQIRELLYKQTGSHVDLPGGLAAERDYENIHVFDCRQGEDNEIFLPILHFRKFSAYNAGEIPKKRYTKWFDYDKIKGTLSFRTRQSGDYLMIGPDQKKRLKAYLVDEKIPRRQRMGIPLLTEENHVVWIIGYRISEYYKITKETKTILEVTADGGENYGG